MRRISFILLLSFFTGLITFAQTPEAFNYQSVIKNAQGDVIANQLISMQVSVLQGSSSGTPVYIETHQPETNAIGLVNLQIGTGTIVSGDFSAINWGVDQYFIKIEADITGGTSYSEIGTMQLLSVPYALYAKNTENVDDADADPQNEIQTLSISGQDLSISEGNTITIPTEDATNELQTLNITGDALSISDGNTVVLPDADPTNEFQNLTLTGNELGLTDGNSISLSNFQSPWMFNGTDLYYQDGNVGVGKTEPVARFEVKASESSSVDDPLFQVINKTGDTVFAVYDGGVMVSFDENAKGNIGGFAVSGRTVTKGSRDYLTVSKDSTRIYVDQSSKGNIGGFAVSGRTVTKGTVNSFLDLTPENYLIGHESGNALTSGLKNTFIGYQSGISTTSGNSNIFIGPESGMNNVYGERNIFIGLAAGKSNVGDPTGSPPTIGHDNIYIGSNSGRDNVDGEHNTLIGSYSNYLGTGTKNTFLGAFTGFESSGTGNVFLGVDAGRNNTAGDHNVFLGAIAGNNNSGSDNTFLGYGSGYNNTDGSGNVFIGYFAGLNETSSNKLYIANSSTDSPLLYGDFTSSILTINGALYIMNNNLRINTNPGNATTPVFYAYQGMASSTGKEYAFAVHDALWVTSHAWVDGTFYNTKGSFELAKPEFQTNIVEMKDINIQNLLELQPNYFYWDDSKFAVKDSLPAIQQIGLNPNQVGKLFPELVKTDERGDKYINYSKLSILLLEAMKEQNAKMETLEKRIEAIENMINK